MVSVAVAATATVFDTTAAPAGDVSVTVGGWVSGCVSNNRTQPPSPSLLLPGGVKFRVPVLANGEPAILVNDPLLGSYHCAVAGALNFVMSTVNCRTTGS